MPRRRKEPHLIRRNARYGRNGKLTHTAKWYIKDGEDQVSTGCGLDDFESAELKLRDYLVAKHLNEPTSTPKKPDDICIGDLIVFYLSKKAEMIKRMAKKRKLGFVWEIRHLDQFWGERPVSDIHEQTSLKFQETMASNSARTMLITLRAIVNFAETKGKLDKGGRILDYALPPKPRARIHYFDRSELAKLLRTAYRKRHVARGFGDFYSSRHLVRFILTAVYTGTRADRIERASFVREEGRPWIDLKHGIFYRKAEGELVPTNKRADPVRIPLPLLNHMKRWHKWNEATGRGDPGGSRYLVEYQGRPVDCRKAFQSLKRTVYDSSPRREQVNRHTLRHTCATWLMQAGVSISLVAKYLSTTERIIEEVYGHHHPDFQKEADHAFSRGKAGRGPKGRQASSTPKNADA